MNKGRSMKRWAKVITGAAQSAEVVPFSAAAVSM